MNQFHEKFFWPNSIFYNFKDGQNSIFELGKSFELPEMLFHGFFFAFIWFHEFFCLDFFKFSGPLCNNWSIIPNLIIFGENTSTSKSDNCLPFLKFGKTSALATPIIKSFWTVFCRFLFLPDKRPFLASSHLWSAGGNGGGVGRCSPTGWYPFSSATNWVR